MDIPNTPSARADYKLQHKYPCCHGTACCGLIQICGIHPKGDEKASELEILANIQYAKDGGYPAAFVITRSPDEDSLEPVLRKIGFVRTGRFGRRTGPGHLNLWLIGAAKELIRTKKRSKKVTVGP